MRIEAAVENENAHFNFKVANFPAQFVFLDRCSKILVQVDLDICSLKHLLKEINEEVNVAELMKDTQFSLK